MDKGGWKSDWTRQVRVRGGTDKKVYGAAWKREAEMTAAVTEQPEAAAPSTTSTAKRLGADDDTAN